MFKEVILNEMDEAEYSGRAPGNVVKFSKLNEWLNNVSASTNAKYLKCIMPKRGKFELCNISDIMFSENIVYRDKPLAGAVTVAFKEDASDDAMTVGRAGELFNAIAAKCAEAGISTDDVQVLTIDNAGRLTTFCWYYDDSLDTAVLVKNMLPSAAKQFFAGTAATIDELARTPRNPSSLMDKLIDELAAVEDKINALQAKRDNIYARMQNA